MDKLYGAGDKVCVNKRCIPYLSQIGVATKGQRVVHKSSEGHDKLYNLIVRTNGESYLSGELVPYE